MDLYLIRHTTPAVEKGICYGQTDLDITDSFMEEAEAIRLVLQGVSPQHVVSSPLQRCSKLAQTLFPQHTIEWEKNIMEINCGQWEMQRWNDIPKTEIDPWMNEFVHTIIPGGESYTQLYRRVTQCFEALTQRHNSMALVAHGGVLRSILSHITQTPLQDSFAAFKLYYGCVVKLSFLQQQWQYQVLHNPEPVVVEVHKPTN